MNKILIICGPTATGKTGLGIKLASQFKTEIISADSRQIYQGMSVVVGKDLPGKADFIKHAALQKKINSLLKPKLNVGFYNFNQVPVWGLDLVKPDQDFSVAHFYVFAREVCHYLWGQGKLPIIVGGTGFWLNSLVKKIETMGVPPDKNLRQKLNEYSLTQLQQKLQKTDSKKWQQMNRSDRLNPRRLIRAIEVGLGSKQKLISQPLALKDYLAIGLKMDSRRLDKQIRRRVEDRVKKGALKEVKNLVELGYSWDLVSMSAIGYKQWQPFLKAEHSLEQTILNWTGQEQAYARRQMVWFKKQPEINWFDVSKPSWEEKVVKLVSNWYY